MSKGRKGCLIVGFVALLVATPWLIQLGSAALDAKKAGLLDEEKTEKYQVSRENNLLAIHKALIQAQESDGQFPEPAKWMDTALIRLKTSDISEAEAKDKLRVPGAASGEFGYAINSSLAGKDLSAVRLSSSTVLVFESRSKVWNAAGYSAVDGASSGKGVTLDGRVVNLK